jgi:hypothetical protein
MNVLRKGCYVLAMFGVDVSPELFREAVKAICAFTYKIGFKEVITVSLCLEIPGGILRAMVKIMLSLCLIKHHAMKTYAAVEV